MRTSVKFGIFVLLLLPSIWLFRLLFLRPFNIDHFFDRTYLLYSMDSPETMSSLRLLDPYGIVSHRGLLDDISVHTLDREERFFAKTAETLRGYDRADLNDAQAVSYDIFQWYVKAQQGAAGPWRFHNYPVNQMDGYQSGFPSFMQEVHSVETNSEARDYVARLYAVKEKFAQVLEGLKIRREKGIVPPDFVLERVLKEMRDFVATPVEQNMLYTSFAEKMEKTKRIEPKDRTRHLEGAAKAIQGTVYPAYATLIAYSEELQKIANHDAGVWKLPDGDAYYRFILSQHTTLDLDPEAIHQLGLKEVARIQAEMRIILQAQGYDIKRPLGEILAAIGNEPRFFYSDDAGGREQILHDYQAMIDEATSSLGTFFAAMPKAGVKVERVPAFMEKTAPGGYYVDPSFDGKRPGVFYTNLDDIKATPKFGMRTLAYHEAVPGHHLQVAISQERKSLPLFRRTALFTAFVEGWGLYAERLAFEAGLEKDPWDNVGRLQSELFRAVRLVVDTGLHAKRWTREQAIDYLGRETGMPESAVVIEVERYAVDPGQACAYMIGMLHILELRERARTALGSKFDIKEFHSLVLDGGAMPLTVLDQQVDRWIKTKLL